MAWGGNRRDFGTINCSLMPHLGGDSLVSICVSPTCCQYETLPGCRHATKRSRTNSLYSIAHQYLVKPFCEINTSSSNLVSERKGDISLQFCKISYKDEELTETRTFGKPTAALLSFGRIKFNIWSLLQNKPSSESVKKQVDLNDRTYFRNSLRGSPEICPEFQHGTC